MTPHVVVLAGGDGRRMKAAHPKALHPVFFRPMVLHVLEAAAALPRASLTLLFGGGERELREQCRAFSDLRMLKDEPGAGAAGVLRAAERLLGPPEADILILFSDAVLLTAASLSALLEAHQRSGKGCTAARGGGEGADAVAYCFRSRELWAALPPSEDRGRSMEAVLDDAAGRIGGAAYRFSDPSEGLDVNEPYGLWRAERVLQERRNRDLMLGGVELRDPLTTSVCPRCRVEPGARIEGGCTVVNSTVGAGAVLESFCRVIDSEVGAGSLLRQGTCVDASRVGRDCRLGPYARLRGGARLDDDVWVGNFVEVKNSSLGSGTRAAHLSFIGDARVGRNVNIGCGFITCNSSGRPLKQVTVIEDGAFIGSASQAVAPVTIGAGAFVATGTSVTSDVPADAFAISRGRQVTKPGYAKKYAKPGAAGLHPR